WFLHFEGRIPETFMYNFDWVARRFLLPLTLWRGRIYSPNEKERTRYGEAATYFQDIRLGTYLKLRHRDPRAARLERDCLAFAEWSGKVQPDRAYTANLLAGVQVEPGPDEELQRWLSGNALLWAHSGVPGFAINRTPWRFAMMGAENGVIDWAIIPRDGDWLFSAFGRLGQGAFSARRTWFFGGGFAGLGTKPDGSSHALVALPDERTGVVLSRAAAGAADAGAQVRVSLELLSSELNGYRRRLLSSQGERLLTREADAGAGTPAPLPGPWLNLDDRIGYVLLGPGGGQFAHGLHAQEANGEFRIPLSWPHAAGAGECCTVVVCDQSAEATAALAASGACRRLDSGTAQVSAAWVRGQDGSDYLVAVNWTDDPSELRTPVGRGARLATVLGGRWQLDGASLNGRLPARSVAVLQVAEPQAAAGLAPQVRLTDPALDTVFVDADACTLRAEASGVGGVAQVRFHLRQSGIFAPAHVIGSVDRPPYALTWRPGPEDRGRYAELWAEAVGANGMTRESSHALVMVRAR
ncbi:MAG: Ig-like domain-containing protein, partial [Armatimonadota bacterium]